MSESFVSTLEVQDLPLWERMKASRRLFSFDLEVTARCPNNCRHCYINLPAGDRAARAAELTAEELDRIAGDAVGLGAMWCLLTGGEPLLRPDFPEIYLRLKRRGLFVSVFTTATLVTDEHLALFRRFPPRDVEVTVYGATQATYERVTRRPGSFAAFRRGLDLLFAGGVKVRLKAMALRSNLAEMEEIARFCRAYTKDYYRFDPVLHLRFDRDPARNAEIMSERLAPHEVVALERADTARFGALERGCNTLIQREHLSYDECRSCAQRAGCAKFAALTRLIGCGAGLGSFNVGYDGTFRLCSSLWAPGTTYDLRHGTVREAWETVVPRVRALWTANAALLRACKSCAYANLCLNCPAHAYLETGELDGFSQYFCDVAHARAEAIEARLGEKSSG